MPSPKAQTTQTPTPTVTPKIIRIPDYEPSVRQTKFHNSLAYETLYGGAAGGGKTAALCAEAITSALEAPTTYIYIFRRTLKELKLSVYEEIQRQIAPYQNLPDARKEIIISYNGEESRFKFSNGSFIQLAYLDTVGDRYRYQSAEIHLLLLDELTHFLEDDYEYLKTRVRSIDPKKRCRIMAATNPGGVGHGWVKERFIENSTPEIEYLPEHPYLDPETKVTRMFIPAKVSDHPVSSFRESYTRTLQAIADDNLRSALLDGNWHAFEGQVFREFKPSTHILTREDFLQTVDLSTCLKFIGFDWGWRDPACATWIALDKSYSSQTGIAPLYIYREIYQNETTPEAWAKQIKEITDLEPVEWIALPHDCYAHHFGDKTIAEVFSSPKYGYNLPIRPVHSLQRGARMNRQALLHQLLSPAPDGFPYLQVHEQCRNFIRTLPALSYSESVPEEIDHKADDHSYDSATYCLSMMREVGALVINPHDPAQKNRNPTQSFMVDEQTGKPLGLHYDPGKALKGRITRDWRYT